MPPQVTLTPLPPLPTAAAAAGASVPRDTPLAAPLAEPQETPPLQHEEKFHELLKDFARDNERYARVHGESAPLRQLLNEALEKRAEVKVPTVADAAIKTVKHLPLALAGAALAALPFASAFAIGNLFGGGMEFGMGVTLALPAVFAGCLSLAPLESRDPSPLLAFGVFVTTSFFIYAGYPLLAIGLMCAPAFPIVDLFGNKNEGILKLRDKIDSRISDLRDLLDPHFVERQLHENPELRALFLASAGLAALPETASMGEILRLAQIKESGFQTFLRLSDRAQALRQDYEATPPHAAASAKLDAMRGDAEIALRDVEERLAALREKLEKTGTLPPEALENLPAELETAANAVTAGEAALAAYRDRSRETEALATAHGELECEAGRLASEVETFGFYPFNDPAYRANGEGAVEELEQLLETVSGMEPSLAAYLDGTEDAEAPEALSRDAAYGQEIIQSLGERVTAMRERVAEEKEKLRGRYEAVMAREIPVTLQSSSIAAVKRRLLAEFPGVKFYDTYYDEDEEEEKHVALPLVLLDLRTLFALTEVLGEVQKQEKARMKDPRFTFGSNRAVARVTFDLARLEQEAAKAFLADPELIASEEFQALSREEQLSLIRETIQDLSASGDADALQSFFANLEIFAAPMAKAFWLTDAPRRAEGEETSLLEDLKALRRNANPAIRDVAEAFWNGYLAKNGYLRKKEQPGQQKAGIPNARNL